MEDLDERPTRFHELNNALHAITVATAVIRTNQESQREQAGRIELAISSVNGRLDRFDHRLTDMEKSVIADRAAVERQIADVRSGLAMFTPVRMIVYGAMVLILTAFANVWITKTMVVGP